MKQINRSVEEEAFFFLNRRAILQLKKEGQKYCSFYCRGGGIALSRGCEVIGCESGIITLKKGAGEVVKYDFK